MRIVSVSRTGNERDIIEPFVRHHARLVDRLLIIDDASTDGTADILRKLRDEGLPIDLFSIDEVNWDTRNLAGELMRIAFDRHAADWVAVLDIDEFIETPADVALRDLLPEGSKALVALPWANFGWDATLSQKIANPVIRLRARMPVGPVNPKILVSRGAVLGANDVEIVHGNHGLRVNGEKLVPSFLDGLSLCHFPVRSVDQFVGKCVVMYLRYVAEFGSMGDYAYQYRRPIELITTNMAAFAKEMERTSRTYGLPESYRLVGKPVVRPLRYLGGPLKYSSAPSRPIATVLRLAERLAQRVAALERRNDAS